MMITSKVSIGRPSHYSPQSLGAEAVCQGDKKMQHRSDSFWGQRSLVASRSDSIVLQMVSLIIFLVLFVAGCSATSKDEPLTFRGHEKSVWCLSLDADGHTLASGSFDDSVILWDVDKQIRLLTLRGDTVVSMTVVFSPDGKSLFVGNWNGSISIWDPKTGKEKGALAGHEEKVNGLAISQDGKILALRAMIRP
jgi:WD40 repeat protein